MAIVDKNIELFAVLKTPVELLRELGQRARTLRLAQNLTQSGVAARAGISLGTLKRFERTGEIQLNYLLRIALVLGRLEEFNALLCPQEVPKSLFEPSAPPLYGREDGANELTCLFERLREPSGLSDCCRKSAIGSFLNTPRNLSPPVFRFRRSCCR